MNKEQRDLEAHLLIQWLAHKNVLDEWMENVLALGNRSNEGFPPVSEICEMEEYDDICNYVCCAFSWEEANNAGCLVNWCEINDELHNVQGLLCRI